MSLLSVEDLKMRYGSSEAVRGIIICLGRALSPRSYGILLAVPGHQPRRRDFGLRLGMRAKRVIVRKRRKL